MQIAGRVFRSAVGAAFASSPLLLPAPRLHLFWVRRAVDASMWSPETFGRTFGAASLVPKQPTRQHFKSHALFSVGLETHLAGSLAWISIDWGHNAFAHVGTRCARAGFSNRIASQALGSMSQPLSQQLTPRDGLTF